MSKHFRLLLSGQRFEVYLKDRRIKEGTFSKWLLSEGTNYVIIDHDERVEDGTYRRSMVYKRKID